MKRDFSYSTITIQDIENNPQLIFICDGDSKRLIVERDENDE